MAALAVIVSFALPSSAVPQQASRQQAAPQQEPADVAALARAGGFSASVEMVRVPVVVEDDDGSFIRGLSSDSFVVRDGGDNHPVSHFVADSEPVAMGILVDGSTAMEPYADELQLAVQQAASNLRPDDEVFLIAYGPNVAMLAEPTTDKLAVGAGFEDYAIWDGADRALFDAVELGLTTLERSAHDKRSLLIIGAGGDTASEAGELPVQQHIHRAGVTVHAIVLSQRRERGLNSPSRVNRIQTLAEIVTYTGGLLAPRPRVWGAWGGAAGWLEAAGRDITRYVKHQYLLHYAPHSPPRPGTWRAIRVLVEADTDKIRARSGYIR